MSNFIRVAKNVADNDLELHALLSQDGVDFTPVVPAAPGSQGWCTIMRTSVWHGIAGDDLPAPIALLVADACVMLGLPAAVALFQAAVQRHMTCPVHDLETQQQFAEYVGSSFRTPGYVPDLARKYQALVLVALFQFGFWRDGHAHLAARLRHTLYVALSWCDQQKEAVE